MPNPRQYCDVFALWGLARYGLHLAATISYIFLKLSSGDQTQSGKSQNKAAAHASGADPSLGNSTSRQNPPIDQNCPNFWTHDAILISFKIENSINICNIAYLWLDTPFQSVWACQRLTAVWGQRVIYQINDNGAWTPSILWYDNEWRWRTPSAIKLWFNSLPLFLWQGCQF